MGNENSLQTPGVTEAVEKLALSGLPGLALVVTVLALVWAIRELLKSKDQQKTITETSKDEVITAKDQQKDDAKANTLELLKVSQTTNEVANKLNVTLTQNTDQMERVEQQLKTTVEQLKENEEALREANEIMRALRDQRTRR